MNRSTSTTSSDENPKTARVLLREPEDPCAVFEAPESRFGEVRRHGQALLALPQRLVRALAGQRVGEDLRDQLQPIDQRRRPVAMHPKGVEGHGPDGRIVSHREREAQVDLMPLRCAYSGPRRPASGSSSGARSATTRRARICFTVHGYCSWLVRLRKLHARQGRVRVCGCDDVRGDCRPLPEHREIDAVKLADTAQRPFDLAVHLVGRHVDEPRRQVGDQRLELEKACRLLGAGCLISDHTVTVHHSRARVLPPGRTRSFPRSQDCREWLVSSRTLAGWRTGLGPGEGCVRR